MGRLLHKSRGHWRPRLLATSFNVRTTVRHGMGLVRRRRPPPATLPPLKNVPAGCRYQWVVDTVNQQMQEYSQERDPPLVQVGRKLMAAPGAASTFSLCALPSDTDSLALLDVHSSQHSSLFACSSLTAAHGLLPRKTRRLGSAAQSTGS